MKKESKKEEEIVVVTLRKLSWKSTFDFGKYKDLSVQQVFDQHHTKVLRWYYYNCSKISYLPEILRAIGIEEKDEISKPGKDPEKGLKLDEFLEKKAKLFCKKAFKNDDKQAISRIVINKRERERDEKYSLLRLEKRDKAMYCKGRMQRKNHGHKDGGGGN